MTLNNLINDGPNSPRGPNDLVVPPDFSRAFDTFNFGESWAFDDFPGAFGEGMGSTNSPNGFGDGDFDAFLDAVLGRRPALRVSGSVFRW